MFARNIGPRNEYVGRSYLARSTALNLIGQLVPMAVGIVTIPILIRHLGTDRFAVITIVWMLIGYFSLFDMGLGRALTQLIAEKIGKNEHGDIPGVFWTSMSLMLVVSVVGSVCLALFAPHLVHDVLKVPALLQSETISTLHIMAVSIPFVILTAACVGVLTAYRRFDIITAIRIPMGSFTFAAPLMILPLSNSLVPIVGMLLGGRLVAFIVHLHYCLKIVPGLNTGVVIDKRIIKPLFRFGGWMSVSNILGPLMVYFDRFLIGTIISIAAVAYYTTPYEFITKLWIMPGALMNVLFPAFASSYVEAPSLAANLFHRSVKCLLLGIFPIAFVIVAGAHQVLDIWLGSIFADNSYRVLQWLTIGVFINCLAQVPFSFLQGIGRPDITSKLHILELVLYIPALWLLVTSHGITGAALAWSVRVALDAVFLFAAVRISFRPFRGISKTTVICFIGTVAALVAIMSIPTGKIALVSHAAFLMLLMWAGWRLLLSVDERTSLAGKLFSNKIAEQPEQP